ncbi:hypothetical protein ACIGW8_22240 [Streptomyces sioyaensis]|uniref:hypothetical protein n=1 Tax=Streptomyces sioyaensis TaxID=67364 RepID=UPI0037D734F5
MTTFIRRHWYRGLGGPCQLAGCGRPRWEHRQAVGEWTLPAHWFAPKLLRPAWCRRCNRTFGHTVHRGSPARWRLRRRR